MRLSAGFRGAALGLAMLWAGAGGLGVAGAEDGVEKLRTAGLAAFNAGDYSQAQRAFDEAYRLSAELTLGVWTARTRVKLGEWVEADDRYEQLANVPITKGDRAAEEAARQQAAREREELRHRLPRLRIRLEGVGAADVEVALDGVPVSGEFLHVKKKEKGLFPHGKSLVVNPGDHRLVGVAGEQRKELAINIAEGQTRDVNLRFINPETLRQRKCADKCKEDCGSNNKCYVDCKHGCFTARE